MKRKLFVLALGVALPLAVGAVLIARPTRNVSPQHSVQIDNFSFAPQVLTIPVNSTVTWVNKDDVPHVIASDEEIFKSKALDTDDKYSYTFVKAGTYSYYCSVHPKMLGKIVVQ